MSAHRSGAHRLACALLLALGSLGATRWSCPMLLAPADEPAAHGCCGEGIASEQPSCCDAGLRTPDAAARQGANLVLAPPARAFVHATPPSFESGSFLLSPAPRFAVHGPPPSILRI